jgi:dihydrofolate reductase
VPGEEVHRFVNDLERDVGTYLYGRRMYETMAYWEAAHLLEDQPAHIQEYAQIWQAAEKVVYSRTLEAPSTAKTRIEREFDPEAVRTLKLASVGDLSIGGAELAGEAIRAGLVDEYQLLIAPVVIGGGKRSLPDDVRLQLELVDERRFGNGMVYLRYRSAA